MNWLNAIFTLPTAFLVVFWEAAFPGLPRFLGAQVDLLPPLLVYAGLRADVVTISLLAFWGGLWFDSLSANPLGITILPLFGIGIGVHICRDLVLRDETFAQIVLGAGATAASTVLSLLLLLTTGYEPLVGWGTLWQLVVVAAGGAITTPLTFLLFEWLERHLAHTRVPETSFRNDREIRRGR
jgi:cell shape-determining protein MreD